jgi:HK97 family phage portal protein
MNIFTKWFKQKKTPPLARTEPMAGQGGFTPFSGGAYANDIYRGAVDAIARNAAKLKGSHIVARADGRAPGDTNLARLLQTRPNPYTNAFDMLYRMVTHYYLYNNAFAVLQKNGGRLAGVYPVKPDSVEFLDGGGALYCKFLMGGKGYIFPYGDIIHLRRNYNGNDLFGEPNTALMPALELAHAQNEGIIKAIQAGAAIRGILKTDIAVSPDNLKRYRDAFIQDFLQMGNNGGVIFTDAKFNYVPLDNKPQIIDSGQQQAVKEKIYAYLGISEKIVASSYTETEWASFYESIIEPVAIQLSLEFTEKIFTPKEQAFGNSIVFEANRLQFAATATKAALIKEVMPLGLLSANQALEILNLPAVPDGGKRIVSLNYVNADMADEYQLEKG